jgi:hypothetical protein
MKVIALLMLVVATFAIYLFSTGGAAAKSRTCANVTVHFSTGDQTYPVKVLKGRVSCRTARSTLRHFIRSGNPQRGWQCFDGHSGQNWAATCFVGNAQHVRKQVRAYNPIAG